MASLRILDGDGSERVVELRDRKLQIELMRARKRRDHAARDLGLLVYRRERGGEVEPRRIDALFLRLDDLVADVTRLEGLVDARRKPEPAASPVTSPVTN